MSSPLDYKKSQHLLPLSLENKETYYVDLGNLESAITGRVDVWVSNTFLMEAVHLVVNGLNLFEMGYFDCAFYSLRQSMEVATTMTYLVDLPDKDRKEALQNWKQEKRFPMQAQMQQELESNENIFKEIKEKMPSFFDCIEKDKRKLHKYVHKQGFDKFYAARNSPLNRMKYDQTEFRSEFEKYIVKSIGVIAVMRLAIDPFPILMMDEGIYRRTGDLLTDSYSDEFVEKYIGVKNIDDYKKTDFYVEHHDLIMAEEEQSEVISSIIKFQYVDTSKFEEILKQRHLLSLPDLTAVLLFKQFPKATKVYKHGGLMYYFNNKKTNRIKTSWSTKDFDNFECQSPNVNIPYDEAFISVFEIKEQSYFLEHNEILDDEELAEYLQLGLQDL